MICIYVFQPCTRDEDGLCIPGGKCLSGPAGPWVAGATCVHVASRSQCMLRLTAALLPNTIFSFINRLKKARAVSSPDTAPGGFIAALSVFLPDECAALLL